MAVLECNQLGLGVEQMSTHTNQSPSAFVHSLFVPTVVLYVLFVSTKTSKDNI
jgi:hypothetical protein